MQVIEMRDGVGGMSRFDRRTTIAQIVQVDRLVDDLLEQFDDAVLLVELMQFHETIRPIVLLLTRPGTA